MTSAPSQRRELGEQGLRVGVGQQTAVDPARASAATTLIGRSPRAGDLERVADRLQAGQGERPRPSALVRRRRGRSLAANCRARSSASAPRACGSKRGERGEKSAAAGETRQRARRRDERGRAPGPAVGGALGVGGRGVPGAAGGGDLEPERPLLRDLDAPAERAADDRAVDAALVEHRFDVRRRAPGAPRAASGRPRRRRSPRRRRRATAAAPAARQRRRAVEERLELDDAEALGVDRAAPPERARRAPRRRAPGRPARARRDDVEVVEQDDGASAASRSVGRAGSRAGRLARPCGRDVAARLDARPRAGCRRGARRRPLVARGDCAVSMRRGRRRAALATAAPRRLRGEPVAAATGAGGQCRQGDSSDCRKASGEAGCDSRRSPQKPPRQKKNAAEDRGVRARRLREVRRLSCRRPRCRPASGRSSRPPRRCPRRSRSAANGPVEVSGERVRSPSRPPLPIAITCGRAGCRCSRTRGVLPAVLGRISLHVEEGR